MVLVQTPAYALPGICTLMLGVIEKVPIVVYGLAWKKLTAGAESPAGTNNGYVMLFVRCEQTTSA